MTGPASVVPGALQVPLLQTVPFGQSLDCSQVCSHCPPTHSWPLAHELVPVQDVVAGGETLLQP
jgi:hypothetical protein